MFNPFSNISTNPSQHKKSPADSNHQPRSKIQVGCRRSDGLPSLSHFSATPPYSPQPHTRRRGGWSAVSPASALAHLPCCHPDCAGLAPKTQQPCACTRPAVHGLSCLHDHKDVRNPGSAHLNDAKKKMHFVKSPSGNFRTHRRSKIKHHRTDAAKFTATTVLHSCIWSVQLVNCKPTFADERLKRSRLKGKQCKCKFST